MKKLLRILHVDNEPDLQIILKVALEDLGGYDLLFCHSGEEALLKAPQFLPDLFLLDVMMPGLSGVETLRELWRIPRLKNIPVVFMTGKVEISEIEILLSHGALDVITKPFNPVTLADQLNQIWLYHFNIMRLQQQ